MKSTLVNNPVSERAEWFDNLIATLRTHELALETNTASPELVSFYKNLMGNNIDELLKTNKAITQQHFVSKIIVEFLNCLEGILPNKLAFDFNDSEVLVWAEIEDNNVQQENLLSRAESKINAQFHGYGFDMETMIVERGDNLPVPNHYKILKS